MRFLITHLALADSLSVSQLQFRSLSTLLKPICDAMSTLYTHCTTQGGGIGYDDSIAITWV